MKFINKAISLLAIIAISAGFTACSDDDNASEFLNSEQVYFPNTINTTIELDPNASNVEVPVARMGNDAVEIPLAVTIGSTNVADISVPNKVTFKEGEKDANITISYDPTKLEVGHFDEVTIAIGKDYNTPYGYSTVDLSLGYDPWISLGKGKISDAEIWRGDEYNVEIQQSAIDPNRFRVVSPFIEMQETENGDVAPSDGHSPYLVFELLQPGNDYNGTTVTESDLVGFEAFNTGYYDVGYSDFYGYHPSVVPGMTEENWLNSKVVQYQEGSTLPAQVNLSPYYAEDFGTEDEWPDDATGKRKCITITFPDAVIKDFSATISYQGKMQDISNQNFVVCDVELGGDVRFAKVALVPGRGMDLAEAVADNIFELENVIDVEESGSVNIPTGDLTESVYTLVVVTFDELGKVKNVICDTFINNTKNYNKEIWTLANTGTYTYKYVYLTEDYEPMEQSGVELYKSETTEGLYKLTNMFEGTDFYFMVDSEGKITFKDQYVSSEITNEVLKVADAYSYDPEYFFTQSYVEDGKYYFNIMYYNNNAIQGYDTSEENNDLETFVIGDVFSAKSILKSNRVSNRIAQMKRHSVIMKRRNR